MNSHANQACAQWVTTVAQWIHQWTGHGCPLQMQENAKAQRVMLEDVKTKEEVQSWDSCQWTKIIQRRGRFEALQDLTPTYLEHFPPDSNSPHVACCSSDGGPKPSVVLIRGWHPQYRFRSIGYLVPSTWSFPGTQTLSKRQTFNITHGTGLSYIMQLYFAA